MTPDSDIANAHNRRAGGRRRTDPGVAEVDGVDASLAPLLREWPDQQRHVAVELVRKYGLPIEATSSRLIWGPTGIWQCTELQASGTPHHFPTPHVDFLVQRVPYRVPAERAGDLLRFNGSITADRTRGELIIRSDSEAMSLLALNLAHEVVCELRSVAEARNKFAEQAAEYLMEGPAPYARELRFELPTEGTADPDVAVIDDELLRDMGMRGDAPFTGDHQPH